MDVLYVVLEVNDVKEVDVVINCVNVFNIEMFIIFLVKEFGIVYFFLMVIGFLKVVLGVEGVGKDIIMIVGNGYIVDYVVIILEELRESVVLREIFNEIYL